MAGMLIVIVVQMRMVLVVGIVIGVHDGGAGVPVIGERRGSR